MKAGTTTLLFRLQRHPDVLAGGRKEPNFFSRDENFSKGVDWYATRWPDSPVGLRGEASVEYADPAFDPGRRAAHAVNQPRRPVDPHRAPSRRAPEVALPSPGPDAPASGAHFSEAVLEPDNEYVRRSLYHRTLAAVDEVFEREQLLVVQTERLEEDGTWQQTLAHIGVLVRAAPDRNLQRHCREGGLSPQRC